MTPHSHQCQLDVYLPDGLLQGHQEIPCLLHLRSAFATASLLGVGQVYAVLN